LGSKGSLGLGVAAAARAGFTVVGAADGETKVTVAVGSCVGSRVGVITCTTTRGVHVGRGVGVASASQPVKTISVKAKIVTLIFRADKNMASHLG
jgi:hypothetical protein